MPLLHTTYSTYFILHTTYYIFRAAWHFALIESVVERTSDWFASAQCDVYGVMPAFVSRATVSTFVNSTFYEGAHSHPTTARAIGSPDDIFCFLSIQNVRLIKMGGFALHPLQISEAISCVALFAMYPPGESWGS